MNRQRSQNALKMGAPSQTAPERAARSIAGAGEVKAVFLAGFMGAGKTTVGRALARRLKWRFIDLDDRIVERERRSIANIFGQSGEAAFRTAETAALRELLRELGTFGPAVVALGGGAFVQPDNARMIKETGAPVVFLDAPVEELRRRCKPKGAARPLYQDENLFRQLYEQRRNGYMAAGIRVNTLGKSVVQSAQAVLTTLGLGKR